MIKELKTRIFGTGLLDEMPNYNEPWADELGLLGGVELPKSFIVEGLELPDKYKLDGMEYEYQGATMTCVANAVTTLAEQYLRLKTGEVRKFSQVHLFFNAGGGHLGSNIGNNLEVARTQGLVSYEKLPLPENPNSIPDNWFSSTRMEAVKIPFENAYKIPGYVKVKGNWQDMKTAMFLYKRPLLVAVRIEGDYYKNSNFLGSGGKSNHIVVVAGWDELNRPIIFDTLGYVRRTEGYRTFGAGYEFSMGYIIKTLDEDWKQKRDEARKEFQYCLDHYGKPRREMNEQETAKILQVRFKRFNNQSVYEAAGRFWLVYINAIVYGGYSYTDCINDCYNYRRVGSHIWNFEKLRSEYKS